MILPNAKRILTRLKQWLLPSMPLTMEAKKSISKSKPQVSTKQKLRSQLETLDWQFGTPNIKVLSKAAQFIDTLLEDNLPQDCISSPDGTVLFIWKTDPGDYFEAQITEEGVEYMQVINGTTTHSFEAL